MLQVRSLSVEVGGRQTLADASFSLRAGDTVGLVGRNGTGKTSLLKVLAGEAPSAGGTVLRSDELGYLPQDPKPRARSHEITALSHVLSGRDLDTAAERVEILRARVDEDPTDRNVARFARAEERYRAAGGYSADAEARTIAHGLGLPDDRLDLPLSALSGGERRRVELARILFAGSELLLLDEPTNHLDTDAKEWLLQFLRSYRGALLVVSHDLRLLDEAITRILHLDAAQMTEYRGTYSQYLEQRAADEVRLARTVAHEQSEIKRIKTLADTMRGQTEKRAKQAKALDTRIARMRRDAKTGPKKEAAINVRFPAPPRPGSTVLTVEGLKKGYGGPPVFADVTFDVGRDERLLIMGLNGAGKTSLMRILAERTEADSGAVRLGHNVSAGYYAQEHEGIAAGKTVLSHFAEHGSMTNQEQRNLLGMFGLRGEIAHQDAGTLSGGEKTKLAPDRVLLMPEGDLDYWSDDLLELVAMA